MNTLEAARTTVEGPLSASPITHADIADFATESVNLNREDAEEYRDQVRRLSGWSPPCKTAAARYRRHPHL